MARSSSAARALALALVALLATSALAGNGNGNGNANANDIDNDNEQPIPPVKAILQSNNGTRVKVDGDVTSTKGVHPYFVDWEWNTPDVDSMLCKWSSATNSTPVCGASVGASANPFFIAPMYQGGQFDKPVTAMLYAQRTCVGESRICVVALANRDAKGDYAFMNETDMWVKTDLSTNKGEVISATAGNLSRIYNGDTLVGFEGCFAVEDTQSGSFMLDAHMMVTVATDPAKGPTTSRVRAGVGGNPGGVPVTFQACAAPPNTCVAPDAKQKVAEFFDCDARKTALADADVELAIGADVVDVEVPAALNCSKTADTRDGVYGVAGTLTYRCYNLARGVDNTLTFVLHPIADPDCYESFKAPYDVVFKPSAQRPAITAAVAAGANDHVCLDATNGELKFTVSGTPALTSQALTGALSPKPEGASCSLVDGVFTCSKLTAQAYTFTASYPDDGCPAIEAAAVPATVETIPKPVLSIKSPADAVEVCAGSAAGAMTAAIDVTGTYKDIAVTTDAAAGTCGYDGLTGTVTCDGLPEGAHQVKVSVAYGDVDDACAAVVLPLTFTVNTIAAPVLKPIRDADPVEVCAGSAAGVMTAAISVGGGAATISVTPSPACVYSNGIVTCDGLPAGPNAVKVSAAYGGCAPVELPLTFTVTEKVCNPYGCVGRGPGYWMTHGSEVQKVIAAAPGAELKLWSVTFPASGVTNANALAAAAMKAASLKAKNIKSRATAKAVPVEAPTATCSKDKPDALRALCVTSSKCELAKLGRQCMAARINAIVTDNAGNLAACGKTAVLGRPASDWVLECCGEAAPAPDAGGIKRCMPALDLINADADNGDAAAALYPNGKPATTSKACNDYTQQFQKPVKGPLEGCQKGFCSTTYFARRLMSDAASAPSFFA